MIEILIPTYNRSENLVKNIQHIDKLVKDEKLDGEYRILISDNASTDDTLSALDSVKSQVNIEFMVFRQTENLGLEKNAVFTLEQATSEYVIFLGDDDFLPQGYLTELHIVEQAKKYGVVIPGFSSLFPDGEVKPGRHDMKGRYHKAGFRALADFSNFGHQLSGLFFKREGVVEAYKADAKNRNIYPFIFFIGFIMQRYPAAYKPEFQVLVSQGNSKDWGYDDSGLLTEIFKNYRALYPHSPIKRDVLCLIMMHRQSWRLRIGRDPLLAIKSLKHLLKAEVASMQLKILLPPFFMFLYLRAAVRMAKRKII